MNHKRITAWLAACSIVASVSCQEQEILDLAPNYSNNGNPGTVVVTPNTATLHPTSSLQLAGVVKNPAGNTVPNQKITWTTSNAAIATVDANGKVTAVAPGTAEITGEAKPRSGKATITVELGTSALTAANVSARHGDQVELTATLNGAGQPLAGRTVTFTVAGSPAGSGVTDASGEASVAYTVTQSAGQFAIATHFESDGIFATADGASQLTVVERPTSIALTNAEVRYSDVVSLEALVIAEGGAGVSGRTVTFSVNGVAKGNALTDDGGKASFAYTADLGAGSYTTQASWTGDNQFAGSSADGQLTVAHKNATVSYNGDVGPTADPDADVTLRALISPVADGGTSDFALPGTTLTVRFVVQHADGFSQTMTAGVSPTGEAQAVLAGLDPRLPQDYTVTAELLPNAFYSAPDVAQSTIAGPASDAWIKVVLGTQLTEVRATLGTMRYFNADGAPGNDIGVGAEYPANNNIRVRVENLGGASGNIAVEVTPDFNPARVAQLSMSSVPAEAEMQANNLAVPAPGRQFIWEASEPLSSIAAQFPGLSVAASSVAPEFSANLLNDAHTTVNVVGGAQIGELRMARGLATLPASQLSNPVSHDLFTHTESLGFHVALRLTNIKSFSVALKSMSFVLQYAGPTKALDVSASYSVGPGPSASIVATLNKPSTMTNILLSAPPVGVLQPIRVQVDQAAPMGSLTVNASNVGNVPTFNVSLSNVPAKLVGCIANDGTCRNPARLPDALANYSGTGRSPTQSATAGGSNRPYPAAASVWFDDFGTSGNSSAVSTMTTMNADITWAVGGQPIRFTNLRFHRLSFDVGLNQFNTSFNANGSTYPRAYVFVDSHATPFVMNGVIIPQTIVNFRAGTDASPASADRRLAWLPGSECSTIIFGTCLPPLLLDARTSGSFNCGGAREFSIQFGGIVMNLLNMFGQALPVCS